MKVALLVNPLATAVSASSQVKVAKILSAHHDVSIFLTNERGHAIELTQQISKKDIEVLIVYGGDGTLNEVANGIAETDLVLGVLPGGSTNVFSRITGLDEDPIVATEQILQALARKNFEKISVGEVNERIFLFHAGVGFDARIVQKVERRSDLKSWMTHALFIWSALTTWFWSYDRKKPHFVVEFDDGEQVESFFAVCLNANPYTYLGSRPLNLRTPQRTAKEVGFNDRLLVVSATSLKGYDVFRFICEALSKKKSLENNSSINYHPAQASFKIYSKKEFPYQIDGDFLGYTTELNFRHRPDCLNFLFPLSRCNV